MGDVCLMDCGAVPGTLDQSKGFGWVDTCRAYLRLGNHVIYPIRRITQEGLVTVSYEEQFIKESVWMTLLKVTSFVTVIPLLVAGITLLVARSLYSVRVISAKEARLEDRVFNYSNPEVQQEYRHTVSCTAVPKSDQVDADVTGITTHDVLSNWEDGESIASSSGCFSTTSLDQESQKLVEQWIGEIMPMVCDEHDRLLSDYRRPLRPLTTLTELCQHRVLSYNLWRCLVEYPRELSEREKSFWESATPKDKEDCRTLGPTFFQDWEWMNTNAMEYDPPIELSLAYERFVKARRQLSETEMWLDDLVIFENKGAGEIPLYYVPREENNSTAKYFSSAWFRRGLLPTRDKMCTLHMEIRSRQDHTPQLVTFPKHSRSFKKGDLSSRGTRWKQHIFVPFVRKQLNERITQSLLAGMKEEIKKEICNIIFTELLKKTGASLIYHQKAAAAYLLYPDRALCTPSPKRGLRRR